MTEKYRLWSIVAIVILTLFYQHCQSAQSQEATQRAPLTGRVEAFSGAAEPVLPSDLLGNPQTNRALSGEATQSGSLPASLKGEWFGRVSITQMDSYPALHPEPYCQSFIQEIGHYFQAGKSGQLSMQFEQRPSGELTVASSDIFFARGLKMMLTTQTGPALVAGGTNIPRPVRNEVTQLTDGRYEQMRIDYVTIIDNRFRRPIHSGYTEVTAEYNVVTPRRMRIKILNVDYDQHGKPLWRALMEGELRHWGKG
jgi:hypothetical protein